VITSAVARRYFFDATHHVPAANPPWSEPHDHRYTVEVVAEGHMNLDAMVVDTDDIDAVWKDIHGLVNNADLNEALDKLEETTVEEISYWMLEEFKSVGVVEVTVWEDEDRWGRARLVE
jgi:6-pyruvoyl-tetrahydropterin synthase